LRKICEVCGRNPAMYVCSECGRNVCSRCFEPSGWLCSDCYNAKKQQDYAEYGSEVPFTSLPPIMKLFLAGFVLIFLGMVVLLIAGLLGWSSQSFGLVVFVGPIPIILGAGKYSLLAILFAVILTIIGVFLFIILRRRIL